MFSSLIRFCALSSSFRCCVSVFLYCLCAALVGCFDKLLFMLFHIRRYSLQVCKDKFFQYAFADIMRSAEHIISCPVAVVAASVGVFPFKRPGSAYCIHFVAAVPAKEQPGKQVNFINLCRALPGGNPLLCKFKGFFINQRFVSVGEEIPFFLRVLFRLFRLIRYLVGFPGYGMP